MHAPEPTAAPAGRSRPVGPDAPATISSAPAAGPTETGPDVPGAADARTRVGTPSRPLTLFLALAGGLVTDAAFPDRGWWPLAFVGVAALFWALRRDGARWGFLVGLVWGLAFFLPHLWWANYATETVPWVALSVMEACFVAVLGAAWVWARRWPWLAGRPWAQAVAFALLFVGVEQARTEVPFGGFPWGRLAFSQADSPLGRAAWLDTQPSMPNRQATPFLPEGDTALRFAVRLVDEALDEVGLYLVHHNRWVVSAADNDASSLISPSRPRSCCKAGTPRPRILEERRGAAKLDACLRRCRRLRSSPAAAW